MTRVLVLLFGGKVMVSTVVKVMESAIVCSV